MIFIGMQPYGGLRRAQAKVAHQNLAKLRG
jgi:hypothetical protein